MIERQAAYITQFEQTVTPAFKVERESLAKKVEDLEREIEKLNRESLAMQVETEKVKS